MSRYVTDIVFKDYVDGLHTDHELSKDDVRKYVIGLMYDDPVAMEELALLCLEEVSWSEVARNINQDAGVV